ncbi:hypothetical protein AKJ65_04110 [candidate division MSBL1 archaeon SCGC-AAA259E19]|uniref:DNA binding HTH domain-containing protein n=1 Tax=candidate division MSBL1 archaeon SCGC-AAA259E19 TaxID=1698264 RepID=A0A133UK45_9EURY|nr:hypothetical protein AKJ65_04110 [candidate division MSBL1 archaeon SCGC-AAA259E19]
MEWTDSEINHIKVSLSRCNIQGLANELGRSKESVRAKIREIKAKKNLSKLCEYAKSLKS